MRQITPFVFPKYVLPDLFTLSIGCDLHQTSITMFLFTKDVTTTHIPHIEDILQFHLPTILRSKCFNQKKLPFSQEVLNTEIGHLFEHILLEYLCKEKIHLGFNEAVFTGLTSWDWNKDVYGTFHITVDITIEEKDILAEALKQSISLLHKILISTDIIDTRYAYAPLLLKKKRMTNTLLTTKKQMG